MATAAFKSNTFKNDRIDRDSGVIYGVRIAELGKVAVFNGPDNRQRHAEITKDHADAFLNHAGNRAIPVHWTHDYLSEKKDRLHAKVGALKNFRKDEMGNPIADFFVSPGEYREQIFWNADHDPENMMFSAVFSYDPNDPKSMPLDFQAADLVEKGAATTALLAHASDNQKTNEMTKEEIEKLFDERAGNLAPSDDLKKEIAALSAKLSEQQAAHTSEIAALSAKLAETEASAVEKATAMFTKTIGTTGTIVHQSQATADPVTAALSQFGEIPKAQAVFKLAATNPTQYNELRKKGLI